MEEASQYIPINNAARLVDCSTQDLLRAAAENRLELYATVEGLLKLKATRSIALPAVPSPPTNAGPTPTALVSPKSTGLQGLDVIMGQWENIPDFEHMWPDRMVEHYHDARQMTAIINGRPRVIVIGFTERANAGMADRGRAVVFYNRTPKERPLVEFSGSGNLATATQYACPIKLRGAHSHLRTGDPVPAEYQQGFTLGVFSDVVHGPNAAGSVAVVVSTDDKSEMLNTLALHGIIRGIYKKWF